MHYINVIIIQLKWLRVIFPPYVLGPIQDLFTSIAPALISIS